MTISLQDHFATRLAALRDTTGALLIGTLLEAGVRKFLRNF
jgi:hypothetical protein